MDLDTLAATRKLWLLDMDGTLYLGERLYAFTAEFLREIRRTGGTYLFLTNNSSKSASDYVAKLGRLGIGAAETDFLTSAQATVYYLKKNHPGRTLYVCGTASLREELRRGGFAVTEDADRAECIVMGFDTELTFRKLEDVSRLLSTRDIPYIATNPDLVCPTEFGAVPDCGSVCAMIRNATGKSPVVIGKPQPLMVELAVERTGIPKDRTCVIGDRIYTDVKCGLNAGVAAVLVMSGETDEAILAASPDRPDLVLRDCGEILELLKTM